VDTEDDRLAFEMMKPGFFLAFSSGILFTRSAAGSAVFKDGVKGCGFLRQAQDTEFIEVQGEP
jgi:hypothetical protein